MTHPRHHTAVAASTFRRRFGRLIFVGMLVFFITTGLWIVVRREFKIQTIEVVGKEVIVKLDERRIDTNLLFFPTAKVRSDLLSENPLLKDVQFHKKYPATLVIVAIPRSPIARVALTGRTVLVDSEGVVLGLASAKDEKLPLIEESNLKQSLGFLTHMKDMLLVESITIIDSKTLLAKAGKLDIYIPQHIDLTSKATTLQTLIRGFRIKGILPKVIDLRFDKPIVTF